MQARQKHRRSLSSRSTISKNSLLQDCRMGKPLCKDELLFKDRLWLCFRIWASFSASLEFMDWFSRAYLICTCLKCIVPPSPATVHSMAFKRRCPDSSLVPVPTWYWFALTKRGPLIQKFTVWGWWFKGCRKASTVITLKHSWINWLLIKLASLRHLPHFMLGLPLG